MPSSKQYYYATVHTFVHVRCCVTPFTPSYGHCIQPTHMKYELCLPPMVAHHVVLLDSVHDIKVYTRHEPRSLKLAPHSGIPLCPCPNSQEPTAQHPQPTTPGRRQLPPPDHCQVPSIHPPQHHSPRGQASVNP